MSRPPSLSIDVKASNPSLESSNPSSPQPQAQPLIITYHGSETLLRSAFATHVVDSIRTQLPLRNLHFRPATPAAITTLSPSTYSEDGASQRGSSSASPRIISELPVELVELSKQQAKAQAEANAFIPPKSALDRPFLHLYLVVCDDVDQYKTLIKPEIQKWITLIRASAGLHVTTQTVRNGGLKNDLLSSSDSTAPETPVNGGDQSTNPNGAGGEAEGAGTANATAQPAKTLVGGGGMDEVAPKDPEYLIVLISPSDSSSAAAAAAASASGSGDASGGVSPGAETSGSTSKVGRFYSSLQKGSVLDKMRQDFNTPPTPGQTSSTNVGAGRRDRIVHMTRLPPLTAPTFRSSVNGMGRSPSGQQHSTDPTMFADLVAKVKDSILIQLEHFVAVQGQELRTAERAKARLLASASASPSASKGESNKLDVSAAYAMWDFCAWAAAKDFLAKSLEGVSLVEEALLQYKDVDLEIQRSVQERSHPYFSKLGGLDVGDDSSSVLDASRKPYRDLIQRGDISLFDCRTYFFARQATILSRMGGASIARVMREAAGFLNSLGRIISFRQSMPLNYIEAWIYTNALLIVERAAIWLVERGDVVPRPTTGSVEADLAAANAQATSPAPTDAQVSLVFHMAKAELLALARRQLDKMGIRAEFLPTRLPFLGSMAEHPRMRNLPPLPKGLKDDDGKEVGISNAELTKALESKDIFDMQYIALAEREIAAWMTAGKAKNVIMLRSVLGALNFARERYQEAYATFQSLPDAYGEEGWNTVEEDQLIMLLESHERLGKPLDEAWAKSAVMLLRAKALTSHKTFNTSFATPLSLESEWSSEEKLWAELRKAADGFAEQQPVTGYPGFIIRPISNQTEQLEDEDGQKLGVTVESHVSIPVQVDDVRLCLTGAKRDQLFFSSGPITLNPGRSRLDLVCPSPPPGRFVIDFAQVRLSNILFQERFGKLALGTLTPGPSNDDKVAKIINIPEDGDALYATVGLPQEVHLDRQRALELSVESGRNHVVTAEIGVTLADGSSLGGLLESKLLEGQDEGLSLTVVEGNSRIQVHDVQARSTGKVLIPLIESATDGVLRLTITVDYITKGHEEVTRNFKRKMEVRIALPLGVNVQDFFRAAALFSKFSISSGGISTLRIQKAELLGAASGFEVLAPDTSEATVVTPRQPAVFVFKIVRSSTGSEEAEDELESTLRLTLRYRTMAEEARAIVMSILSRNIDKASYKFSQARINCIRRVLGRLIEDRLDVDRYAVTGEIWAADFIERAWQVTCDRWGLGFDSNERKAVLELVKQTMLEATECDPHVGAQIEALTWRALCIPVDVPRVNVVNSTELELEDVRPPLIVGQPYSATIRIKTSYAWGVSTPLRYTVSKSPSEDGDAGTSMNPRSSLYAESEAELDFEDAQSEVTDTPRSPSHSRKAVPSPGARGRRNSEPQDDAQYALTYEVVGAYDSWLVSGDQHGQLSHQLSGISNKVEDPPLEEFKIKLIPLRHGSLLLPTITVKPVATQLPFDVDVALEDPGLAPPTCETFQNNAADRVDVVPRRSRGTYWVDLPSGAHWNAQAGARVIPA